MRLLIKLSIIIILYILNGNDTIGSPKWQYKTITRQGIKITYAIVLPKNYDSNQTYPLLIALPPGGQNKNMVDWGLNNYWAAEGYKRGWIIVSPVRVSRSFSSSGFIPTLIGQISEHYLVNPQEIHLAGISNGGLSSFKVLLEHPNLFKSVTVLAGYTNAISELYKIKHISYNLLVGENDTNWKNSMQRMLPELKKLNSDVLWKIIPEEGHEISSLMGGRELFDVIERNVNNKK